MRDRRLHFNWHRHPEFELLVCSSGRGQAHVGDLVADFQGPAAFLIAGDLPHGFASDGTICGWIAQIPRRDIGGAEGRPELEDVARLLEEARKGVRFGTRASAAAVASLENIDARTGLARWLGILGVLDELARDNDRRPCSYAAFRSEAGADPSDRASNADGAVAAAADEPAMDGIDLVVSSLFDEATATHRLVDVSRRAGMPISTFCRTFKRRFGLTFVEYLHSIRINTAKKLLIQTHLYVDDVCYECGFNNVSFFDRKFKQLTGMTPIQYRNTYAAFGEDR